MFTPEEIKKLEVDLQGEKKAEALKLLIDSIDKMVTGMATMKIASENLSMTCDKYKQVAEDSQKAVIDLTTTIKHIHIALGRYLNELPPELVDLTKELGTFVMSGAAIKAGVIKNANA